MYSWLFSKGSSFCFFVRQNDLVKIPGKVSGMNMHMCTEEKLRQCCLSISQQLMGQHIGDIHSQAPRGGPVYFSASLDKVNFSPMKASHVSL